MNSWKLILATVVIFGAGVVVGGLLVNYTVRNHAKTVHHPATAGATTNRPPAIRPIVEALNLHQPEILSQHFVEQLDDALQLTPPQRDAIQKIIACGQEQNHTIWTNCSAQSRQVLQEVRQHIREQLNPDQRKQFEVLLKQARPVPRRTGTNSIPGSLPATNPPAILTTNLAGGN